MESLVPLGDQAALAYFANEDEAIAFAHDVRDAREPWLVDVVSAYASVAVFFDLKLTSFREVAERLRLIVRKGAAKKKAPPPAAHLIPCCYEFGLDLARVVEHTGLAKEEVIGLHTATPYRVYAIGFCPGFPYLGYLPARIDTVPRLNSPRVRVEPGSVALAGRQTGIYTEARPGGWNIIGQTPLELVNVADNYFPLRTGDTVQFRRIDECEFERLKGERL
jgi:inhibitor of KinA